MTKITDSGEDARAVSKSQLKREADELFQLGKAIVALQAADLLRMPLDDDLRSAIDSARTIRAHGALKRQQQYIGKLLRQRDVTAIRDAIEKIRLHSSNLNTQFKLSEQWRDRLLTEGKVALEEFIRISPDVNRQQLHQMIRNARKETEAGKPPKWKRALFRFIRDVMEEK